MEGNPNGKDFYERHPVLGGIWNFLEWLGLYGAAGLAAKAGVTYAELDPEIATKIRAAGSGIAFLSIIFGVPPPSRWFKGKK